MEGLNVHHIGYAVQHIDKAKLIFEMLGFVAGEVIEDDIRAIKILFLKKDGVCIELVAPNGEDNPVDNILKKNGATPYHICYEVENLNEAIQSFRTLRKGWVMLKQPEMAPALGNREVAFLFQKDIGLVELVEKG